MFSLRATAKTFTPGSLNHIIKRVSWNPRGITNVMILDINEEEVIKRGRESDLSYGLHKTSEHHPSKIKNNNKEEAVPFDISEEIIPIIPIHPPTFELYYNNITLDRYNYCDN